MRALRRFLVVAVVAALVGAFVRLRGTGNDRHAAGGWRELAGPDFR